MERVLERLQTIGRVDRSRMLNIQMKMPDSLGKSIRESQEFFMRGENLESLLIRPNSIVVAGIGGSAIGGRLLRDWLMDRSAIPVIVSNGHNLPRFVDQNSLVFVVSYSGSTEETMSMFHDAVSRRCRILVLSSGGMLAKESARRKIPFLPIPEGLVPRAALPFLFVPMAVALDRLLPEERLERDMSEALKTLVQMRSELAPEKPVGENPAKDLALDLRGTIPLIYAQERLSGVGFRMKTQFNENSKIPCYVVDLPEGYHNDVVGYQSEGLDLRGFSAILLTDEEGLIDKRIEVLKELILPKVRTVKELRTRGQGRLAGILSMVYLGDVASTYLAILNGVDPTPTEYISLLKATSNQ